MELLIIFLISLPGILYFLDRFNFGKSKETELLIPNLSVDVIRSLLIEFSRAHSWALLHEDYDSERYIFVFQSGQWARNKDGVQRINITFFPGEREMRCFIRSESKFTQLFDFGMNQKNIEGVSFFLSEETKQDLSQIKLNNTASFLTPQPLVYPKYFVVLVSLLILIIGAKAIYSLTRVIVPGRVQITFYDFVSEEISHTLLLEFGAINCINYDKTNINAFECEVPIREEKSVADKARNNPTVQFAAPKYER